ncbi:TolA protein, putative, partial [Hondaea fermentalgiana]
FGDNIDEAEKVWTYHNSCVELDPRSEEGNELDEMKAHILLERTEGALTVRELRERLKSIDLDFNKYVSLTEYLVTSYNVDWRELVHAPQGEVDEAKLSLAQDKVEEAKQAIADCEARAKEAKA